MLHYMSTLNPRITVTLTPAVAAVLKDMSALGGNSQSSIVGELLSSALPVLERVVATLRAGAVVEAAARQEIAAGLDRAQERLERQMGSLMDEFDTVSRPLFEEAEKVQRRAKKAESGGSTPVPVTRGLGGPAGATLQARKRVRRG
jgi:hypothetical protein